MNRTRHTTHVTRTAGAVLALLLPVVLSSGCASRAQASPARPKTAQASPARPSARPTANQQVSTDVADALQPQLQAEAEYAYLQITPRGLTIGVTGAAPAVHATVTQTMKSREVSGEPAAPVVYVHVRHTWAQLQALTAQVLEDRPGLQAQGVDPTSWGPDIPTNTVLIGLAHYTPAAASILTARYGSLVTVSTTSSSAGASGS